MSPHSTCVQLQRGCLRNGFSQRPAKVSWLFGSHFQLNFWPGVLKKPHVETPADETFYSREFSAESKAKLKIKFAAWEVEIQEISSSLSRTLVSGGEREIGACFLAKLQKNFQSEIKIPANKTSVVGAFTFFGCARIRKVLKSIICSNEFILTLPRLREDHSLKIWARSLQLCRNSQFLLWNRPTRL